VDVQITCAGYTINEDVHTFDGVSNDARTLWTGPATPHHAGNVAITITYTTSITPIVSRFPLSCLNTNVSYI
jgi:preprotein translocase subunit SecF